MLPYFAAAEHNLYTKSMYIYLQQMLQLQAQHPDVYAFLPLDIMRFAAVIAIRLAFHLT